MKGFKTLAIVIFVGSTALVAVIAYLMHRPEKAAPVEVVIDTRPDGLNVDMKTAYLECSHYGKEWQFCTSEAYDTYYYCSAYSEYNESDLALFENGEIGVPSPFSPCFTCPAAGISCDDHVKQVFTAAGISEDQNANMSGLKLWEGAIWLCEYYCQKNMDGESCSEVWDTPNFGCMSGALFCDYKGDDLGSINGTCKSCPIDVRDCYKDGFVSSKQGKNNCLGCQMRCWSVGASKVWVDGLPIPSQPVRDAIQSSHQNATGALHDCSNLSLESATLCPGAKGKMCLVYFEVMASDTSGEFNAFTRNAAPWQVSDTAEGSGCVGVIAFDKAYGFDPAFKNLPHWHEYSELLIPYVYITEEEGLVLLDSKIGMDAKVQVDIFGAYCYSMGYGGYADGDCNMDLPCDDDSFCAFFKGEAIGPDLYSQGRCSQCPEDPTDCYFDAMILNDFYYTVQNVESCAKACDAGAALASIECKFRPTKLTEFSFGVDNEEDRCQFCPLNDVQFPDRTVPMFGDDVTCSQMESFFERLPVPNDSSNCQLAQSTNYICGCEGQGYAGADTSTKKVVLAWLPRTAAILSMLGSFFIIVDTQQTPQKRAKLINKILCATSVFDVIGSFAMSFTTLPTQQEDYLYGSHGNDRTCKAQGFFIQMGTIACLMGVSLALYYNFTIKQGWNEARMKRNHILQYLLAIPIAIGLAFACAGIPFYDNVLVWCNNSAKWWPEIPIVLALFDVTVIMADVIYTVHQQEMTTSQYTGLSRRLSKIVFHQAIFFVGAFYITWIPYLVLQYMLSSGKGYDKYGLTLAASTMCARKAFGTLSFTLAREIT